MKNEEMRNWFGMPSDVKFDGRFNQVYKIPDGRKVYVFLGYVMDLGSLWDDAKVIGQNVKFLVTKGEFYQWGWLDSQYFFDHHAFYGNDQWQQLFNTLNR